MPSLTSRLNRGEIEVAHNNVWMAMKWQDKREVYMLTTVHEVAFAPTGNKHFLTDEDIIKPICVIHYNSKMGSIDNIDKQLSLTESVRKSMKWYRKLFFHLVDLVLTNAHALFKMDNGNISFPDFRLRVVKALLKLDPDQSAIVQPGPARLLGRHFPNLLPEKGIKNCALCWLSKKRSRTRYCCSTCNTALCVTPCFEIYHTQQTLP